MATTSPSQRPLLERVWVEMSIAGRSNMRFATIAPTHAPTIWTTT